MDDPEFMKQFSGSATANVVTVLLLGVLMILKKCVEKNKHSQCKSCCFSFELDNKTERSKHGHPTEEGEDSGESEEEEVLERTVMDKSWLKDAGEISSGDAEGEKEKSASARRASVQLCIWPERVQYQV